VFWIPLHHTSAYITQDLEGFLSPWFLAQHVREFSQRHSNAKWVEFASKFRTQLYAGSENLDVNTSLVSVQRNEHKERTKLRNRRSWRKWRNGQGRHLRGDRKLEGSTDPQRFMMLVFPCKLYLWNSATAARTIRYIDWDPHKDETANDLLEWQKRCCHSCLTSAVASLHASRCMEAELPTAEKIAPKI